MARDGEAVVEVPLVAEVCSDSAMRVSTTGGEPPSDWNDGEERWNLDALRMAERSGSLWIPRNGGERWRQS